jgi:hypothetical protein
MRVLAKHIFRALSFAIYRDETILRDAIRVKRIYKQRTGKRLRLIKPRTFGEKLQWLKLFDRRPEYTRLVDKLGVRSFITEVLGEEYLIPLIAVYENADDIDFTTLPDRFVIKCTHDSGSTVVCRDKSTLDTQAVREKMRKCLSRNYYDWGLEWPYKNVKPRVIVEEYMVDESGFELKDYKFSCFNGIPKGLMIASGRFTDLRFDFYDEDFNRLSVIDDHPNADQPPSRPASFETMKELARKISAGIPFVRVDFYDIKGKVYFGEMTFFPGNGMFDLEERDYILGDLLDLNLAWKYHRKRNRERVEIQG